MDWILFWQIVGPIIGVLLGIGVTLWLHFWSRREKVVIQYSNVLAQLKMNGATGIQFEYSFSLIHVRGARDLYVSEIWIEFNKSVWRKLKPYFELPLKMGSIAFPKGLPRLEVGKPEHFGYDAFFPVRRTITDEERKELDSLVQELWHQYKIGWKDTYERIHCRTINQLRDIKKSFKLAM